jgi:ATP-dependent Clp protease ATP-binding subunit ClpX
LLQYIIPKDIKDFGLIPEIIGRLPVLTHMDPLDRDSSCDFDSTENALIKQYQNCF